MWVVSPIATLSLNYYFYNLLLFSLRFSRFIAMVNKSTNSLGGQLTMNATQHHPIERLRVSNIGYSPKHVNNIAQHLANAHSVPLPYHFPHAAQNFVAEWIISKFGYDKELIRRAD